jgi:cytosine/uracil/thiamine/allantoin permease
MPWQSFCINIPIKDCAMVLIEMSNQLAERIYEASFFLGLAVSALFYMKYRKYSIEMQKDDMIDRFLQ